MLAVSLRDLWLAALCCPKDSPYIQPMIDIRLDDVERMLATTTNSDLLAAWPAGDEDRRERIRIFILNIVVSAPKSPHLNATKGVIG